MGKRQSPFLPTEDLKIVSQENRCKPETTGMLHRHARRMLLFLFAAWDKVMSDFFFLNGGGKGRPVEAETQSVFSKALADHGGPSRLGRLHFFLRPSAAVALCSPPFALDEHKSSNILPQCFCLVPGISLLNTTPVLFFFKLFVLLLYLVVVDMHT